MFDPEQVRLITNPLLFCYSCVVCPATFWNFAALHHHYHDEHKEFEFHICLFDGIMFKTITALRPHFVSHQVDNQKAMLAHAKMKATIKPTPHYTCQKCERKFKTLVEFQTHLTIHLGARNFSCGKNK